MPRALIQALELNGHEVEIVSEFQAREPHGLPEVQEKLQADGYLLERSICYAIERNRMMGEVYRLQREWENIFQSIGNPMIIIDPVSIPAHTA